MSVMSLDWETRSAADLKAVGLWNYARHRTTGIWCGAYAFDDEPVELWTPDQVVSQRVVEHIAGGGAISAWNFPFEITINNAVAVHYGWPAMKPEQGYCSMAMAYAMGLPGALADAAPALGLEARKDAEGHALMLRLCRPRKIEADGTIVWWADAEKLERLYAYCKTDVDVERAVRARLMPLSDSERRLWLLDYRINQRGVQVDMETARAAIKLTEAMKEKFDEQIAQATGGAATTCTALGPIKEWLAANGAPEAKDGLAKQDVIDLLNRPDLPAPAREVLTLRQEAGKASAAKFEVMVRQAGDDGRLRNLYQYHGAGTGRWTGRGVQVQNLPRGMPNAQVVESVLQLIREGNHDAIDAIFGSPLTMASRCLRSFFVAPAGKVLVSGDFANVEGRGQAWFAGEDWKIHAFVAADNKTGPGLYELAYSRMFGVPVESIKNPSEERQVGKVCLAAGTRIVTHRGILDILDVTTEDMLWDGVEWVRHDGLLNQGLRRTVCVDGIEATPDHLMRVGRTWRPAAQLASNASILSRALATGSENLPWSVSRTGRRAGYLRFCGSSVLAALRSIAFTISIFGKGSVPAAGSAALKSQGILERISGHTQTSFPTTAIGGAFSTAYRRVLIGATTQTTAAIRTTAGAESMSSLRGAKRGGSISATSSPWMGGISRTWSWIALTSTKAMSRAIFALYRAQSMPEIAERSSFCRNESQSLKPVFDLANAGPRRRFTVCTDSGFLIVHNCELAFGYQGGVGSFHKMGKNYNVKVSDGKADEFKVAWREAHPAIVKTWYALQRAAIAAVREPGSKQSVGIQGRQAWFRTVGSFLWCLLPSGRAICYPYPKLLEGDRGPQLTYMTVPGQDKSKIIYDPDNRANWARVGTYGGSLFNNVVQGFSRDLQAWAMTNCEEAGLPIVLHTHDDLNAEVDETGAEARRALMEQIMRTPPAWAAGFPLYAECKTMRRYGK